MGDLAAMVEDGPCLGTYDVRRCARRMVFTVAPDGQMYALDEDGDQVEPGERAYVYEASGNVGWLCGRGISTRYVNYRYAGVLDADTGEFTPAGDDELEAVRKDGRERVLAWARSTITEAWEGRKPTPRLTAPAAAEPQGALF